MSAPQEVRQVFTWDATGVERGAQTIERAYDREKRARESSARAHGSGGAGANNFSQGIRDLAEGRGVNAMQRFGHTIGVTAGRLAFYMLAMRAAGEATRHLREELEKTDAASRQLESEFSANTRMATVASSAQKPGTLTASIRNMDEGSAKENDQQVGLGRAAEMLEAMRNGNPLSKGAAMAIEAYNGFQGKRTPEEESRASEGRGSYYAREAARMRGLRSTSYAHETEIATANGPGGNPFEAKRKELDIQQKLEESEARTAGLSKTDLENIRTRYDILRKTVSAEESIILSRQAFRSQDIAIQRGPQGAFQKSLGLASARIGQSERLRGSGLLNEQQDAEEALKIQQLEANRYQTIQGRYLNADGSRRRAGDINRDFRRDRKESRARARFQRQYDRGGFDPETGRRRATGDAPGSGLHSGGLQTGGLRTGSLSSTNWKETFTPPGKPAGGGNASSSSGKTTTDLYTLLDSRLPGQTA